MQIKKQQKMKMVDVYTVDGVDFLSEEEAKKFYNDNVEKLNQLLFKVSYAPVYQNKNAVYTKKMFVSIKKKEVPSKVALIVALNEIAQKHKGLLVTQTFKRNLNDQNPIIVDGFKIEQIKFNDSAEYRQITERAYKVNGKLSSVKLYKTNEFGNLLNK